MISKLEMDDLVREWSLRHHIVEKDYVLGWLLWGVGSDPMLSTAWAFKGGTCLKKCYVETYRFSEDLDFTVLPGGPRRAAEVGSVLVATLQRVGEASGIDFTQRQPVFETHSSGNYTLGRIYYRGPLGAPQLASVRIDLVGSERVVRPTVLRPISHAYSDTFPPPATVRCYSFEEVFAEKLRAMGERGRPRDLYDIVNLFRRRDLRAAGPLVRQVLLEKCEAKGVPVPTLDAVLTASTRNELESEWGNMLAHQLPSLPPVDGFLEELPLLFAWLHGGAAAPPPPALATGSETGEPLDDTWSAPTTMWRWGAGAPFETIRFAAANHLSVELGYQGKVRVIEPYSLRRTRGGHILLYAVKVESGQVHAYRVDRITGVRVTDRVFRPRYQVEMTAIGPISVQSRRGRAKRPRRAPPP